MRQLIFKKRHSLVLVLGSFLYALKILNNPQLYDMRAYEVLRYALSPASLGWWFIFGCSIKMIGIFFNRISFKIIGLGILGGLWFVVFSGLFVQDFQGGINAGYIFTGMIFLDVLCIAIEEVIK